MLGNPESTLAEVMVQDFFTLLPDLPMAAAMKLSVNRQIPVHAICGGRLSGTGSPDRPLERADILGMRHLNDVVVVKLASHLMDDASPSATFSHA
jgi:hypothetical protein